MRVLKEEVEMENGGSLEVHIYGVGGTERDEVRRMKYLSSWS
jgi:hypothetical protein